MGPARAFVALKEKLEAAGIAVYVTVMPEGASQINASLGGQHLVATWTVKQPGAKPAFSSCYVADRDGCRAVNARTMTQMVAEWVERTS